MLSQISVYFSATTAVNITDVLLLGTKERCEGNRRLPGTLGMETHVHGTGSDLHSFDDSPSSRILDSHCVVNHWCRYTSLDIGKLETADNNI